MKETANSTSVSAFPAAPEGATDRRILRTMAVAVAIAAVLAVALAPWRVAIGLLLGGLLSLLNYHWMRTSISAAFDQASGKGAKPRIQSAQYILRYFVVAIAVITAYKLNIVSLPATIAGLCSFVVALFVEAFREVYFAIFHREETS